MTLVVILSLITVLGLIWSIVLLRHARDWPMRLLAILLGLSPVYQTVAACRDAGVWNASMAGHWKTLLDLVINAAFLFCLYLLHSAIERVRKAEVQIRLMERPLVLPTHHEKIEGMPG